MHKLKYLLTIAIIFALTCGYTSCSEDDDKGDTPNTSQSQNGSNTSSSENQTSSDNNGSTTTDNNGTKNNDNQDEKLTVPEDCISGVFSVSANKKVFFSKGNLQYDANNQKFQFAEHQWDIIGENGANISETGIRDLFAFATWLEGGNPMVSNTSTSNLNWDDTKSSVIGADWHTLSNDEWAYLINRKESYGIAEVNGVKGLVLLPDNFTLPAGITFNTSVATKYSETAFKDINDISSTDWDKMEKAGAVFLPAAGDRTNYSTSDEIGNYWSSTEKDSENAYYFKFAWWGPQTSNFKKFLGHSVRLVKVL